jgi:hypothetical protein
VLGISFLAVSCSFLEDIERKVVSEYHFTIEPDSLLQSIASSEEDIFSSVDGDFEPNPSYADLVSWDQFDYIKIVDALHKFVWGDSVQDWDLNYMSFSLLCDQVNNGFQIASLSFFHEQNDVEHQIDIYPSRKLINAWEFVYNSRLSRRNPFELTSALVTADEALMIAEKAGGLENRIAFNNDCEISVILSPYSANYRGWSVLYSLETYSDTFSITVDPITGQIIK